MLISLIQPILANAFQFEDYPIPEEKSWWEWILDEVSKLVVVDGTVWAGRILVTLAIVLAWDVLHAVPKQKPKQKPVSPPQQPNANGREQQQVWSNPAQKRAMAIQRRNCPPTKESSRNNDGATRTQSSMPEGETTGKSRMDLSSEEKKNFDSEEDLNKTKQPISSASSSPTPRSESLSNNLETQPSPSATTPTNSIEAATTTTSSASALASIPVVGSNEHPGLEAFWHWFEVETSLYRIYTLAHKDPSIPTVPPYAPSSRRGRVPIELVVTNQTRRELTVFWVDYKGRHVSKGNISRNGGVWKQTTWIDHPWVFEDAATSTPYLYYVPYRAIPTIPRASTMGSDGTTGVQRFAITDGGDTPFHVGIRDEVLPFPGSMHLNTSLKAINWTLLHLSRAAIGSPWSVGPMVDLLQKYLANILELPEEWKYRNLKIAGKTFRGIWAIPPLQGLLLAAGFVDDQGMCRLGRSDCTLPGHWIQDISLLSYLLGEWKNSNFDAAQPQPSGADGFGRAGFGRPGHS